MFLAQGGAHQSQARLALLTWLADRRYILELPAAAAANERRPGRGVTDWYLRPCVVCRGGQEDGTRGEEIGVGAPS